MNLPDFLRSDEHGEIFLAGHRVTLYHIVKEQQTGASPSDLAATYPTLAPSLIDRVLDFYLRNRAEVDRYVEETRLEIERQAAIPSRGPSLAELKQRLDSRQRSQSA